MTNEQAKQSILTYCVEECGMIDACELMVTNECVEALAIQALEKQMPKKPRIKETITAGSMYVCECGHWLKEVFPLRYKPKFCSHCGQRIDWEVEE